MKRILAVNPGGYPRAGETADSARLREAAEGFKRGTVSEEELKRVREETVRDVLQEQARAGVDVVSDGQVRWHDPVSHVMGRFNGVSLGGPRRYFDSDLHYLRPRVTGSLELRGSILAEEVKWARAVSMRPVTVTLTGPLSLSRLSEVRGGPYENQDRLAEALVPFLAEEVDRLAKAGADSIVVEEPSLSAEPESWPLVRDALEVLAARKGGIKLWLFPSFGDARGLGEKLQELAVDGVILDLSVSGPVAGRIASAGGQLSLGLGMANARVMKLESPAEMAAQAAALLRRFAGDMIWLCPSGSLENLPRRRAWEKLAVLARARDLLAGRMRRKSKRSGYATRKTASRRRRVKGSRRRSSRAKRVRGARAGKRVRHGRARAHRRKS